MYLLNTMCFHFGKTSNYIWDCGTPHERVAMEGVFDRRMKDIHYEFVNDGGKIQYSHNARCSIEQSHYQGQVSLPGDQLIWDLWWTQ